MKCFFVFCLLWSNVLIAQIGKIGLIEFYLPNGLYVILHENHEVPIVSVGLLYAVGTKDDAIEQSGLVKFAATFQSNGGKQNIANNYSKIIQNAGGKAFDFIGLDKTCFYETVPSNQLTLALWIEAERMRHDSIDTIMFALHKNKFIEKASLQNNLNALESIENKFFNYAYKLHPYKKSHNNTNNKFIASLDTLQFNAFLNQYYSPNNATLCISGDFDKVSIRSLIYKYFSNIPVAKSDIYTKKIYEPEWTKEVKDTLYDDRYNWGLSIAYHIPAMTHKDMYAIKLFIHYLNTGRGSAFQKMLYEKQAQISQVTDAIYATEDPGLAILHINIPKHISISQAEKLINQEIEKLQLNVLSDDVMNRTKNKIIEQLTSQINSNEHIVENVLTFSVFYKDSDKINTEIKNYLSVSANEVLRVANQYFNYANRVVLYLLPNKKQM